MVLPYVRVKIGLAPVLAPKLDQQEKPLNRETKSDIVKECLKDSDRDTVSEPSKSSATGHAKMVFGIHLP